MTLERANNMFVSYLQSQSTCVSPPGYWGRLCMGWGQTGRLCWGGGRTFVLHCASHLGFCSPKTLNFRGLQFTSFRRQASTGSRAEPTTGGTRGAAEVAENQAHPLHPSLSQAAPPCPFWGQTVMMSSGGWQQPYPLFPCVGWTPSSALLSRLTSSELDSRIFFF